MHLFSVFASLMRHSDGFVSCFSILFTKYPIKTTEEYTTQLCVSEYSVDNGS